MRGWWVCRGDEREGGCKNIDKIVGCEPVSNYLVDSLPCVLLGLPANAGDPKASSIPNEEHFEMYIKKTGFSHGVENVCVAALFKGALP